MWSENMNFKNTTSMKDTMILLQGVLKPFGKQQISIPSNFASFQLEKHDLYEQIHQDCVRAWKTLSLFSSTAKPRDCCRCFQALFERILVDTWQVGEYYQGATDILEIIVASFIDFEALQNSLNCFEVSADDFKPLLVSPHPNLFSDYHRCIAVSQDIAHRYFIDDLSGPHVLEQYSGQTLRYISEYDPELFKILQKDETIQQQLIKFVPSLGAKQAKSFGLSAVLAVYFLRQFSTSRSFVLSAIVQLCCRAAQPALFQKKTKYQIFVNKIQCQECVADIGWCSHAVVGVLANAVNSDILVDFLQFVEQEGYQQ